MQHQPHLIGTPYSLAPAPVPPPHPAPSQSAQFSFAPAAAAMEDFESSLFLAHRPGGGAHQGSEGMRKSQGYQMEGQGGASGTGAGRIALPAGGGGGGNLALSSLERRGSYVRLAAAGVHQQAPRSYHPVARPAQPLHSLPAAASFATTSHHFPPASYPLSLSDTVPPPSYSLSATGSGDSSASFSFGGPAVHPLPPSHSLPRLELPLHQQEVSGSMGVSPAALHSSSGSSAVSGWSIEGEEGVVPPLPPSKPLFGWELTSSPPSLEPNTAPLPVDLAPPAWTTLSPRLQQPVAPLFQPEAVPTTHAYRPPPAVGPARSTAFSFPTTPQAPLSTNPLSYTGYALPPPHPIPFTTSTAQASPSAAAAAYVPVPSLPLPSLAVSFSFEPSIPAAPAYAYPSFSTPYSSLPHPLPPVSPYAAGANAHLPQTEKAKRPPLSRGRPPNHTAAAPVAGGSGSGSRERERGASRPRRMATVKAMEALRADEEGSEDEVVDDQEDDEDVDAEGEVVPTDGDDGDVELDPRRRKTKPAAPKARRASHARTALSASTSGSVFSFREVGAYDEGEEEGEGEGYSTAPTSAASSPVASTSLSVGSSGKKPAAPKRAHNSSSGVSSPAAGGGGGTRPKLFRSAKRVVPGGDGEGEDEGVWESTEDFFAPFVGREGVELRTEQGMSVTLDPTISTPSSFIYDSALSSWRTYRRNFLSLTASLTLPTSLSSIRLSTAAGPLSLSKTIKHLEVDLSAATHPQGTSVELLQFDADRNLKRAKTLGRRALKVVPPPPANAASSSSSAPKGTSTRPAAASSSSAAAAASDTTLQTTFTRVQFRASTSNHPAKTLRPSTPDARFVVRCTLFAVLDDADDEGQGGREEVELGGWTSALLQVRGRSPKNFAKKDGNGKGVEGEGAGKGKGKKRKTSPLAAAEEDDEVDELDSDGDDDGDYTPKASGSSSNGKGAKRRRLRTPSSPLAMG
ncbi:hypothetical protein JCM6882_003753 [Rhodosporidiobolus microsporus]